MRTFAAIALAACLAACTAEQAPAPPAPAAPEQAPNANALTAQGWGPLRIGMTVAEITAALGPDADPDSVGGADPAQCDQYRPERAPEGMLLMVEQGLLTRISLINESPLKTDRGFGLGDSAAAIKAAHGASATSTPHRYAEAPAEYIAVWTNAQPGPGGYVQDPNARGIVYETGANGIVQTIHAGGPSIQYVEGCS
ncbi:MAG: hypothetical protein H7124_07545 [Phycisphaerales bacterium]|nr:hypothetical protein [Hyphomonadaceae bacterium]